MTCRRQYNGKIKTKGQTVVYKTLHRILKIEQHKTPRNSSAPEMIAVLAPLVTAIMLLLKDTNIISYGYRIGHQFT